MARMRKSCYLQAFGACLRLWAIDRDDLPLPGLREQHANGDVVQLIYPVGKHAALIRLEAFEVRPAHGAIAFSEL
jgi:hypothetical protein